MWQRLVSDHEGFGMDANKYLFNAFVLVEEEPPVTSCFR